MSEKKFIKAINNKLNGAAVIRKELAASEFYIESTSQLIQSQKVVFSTSGVNTVADLADKLLNKDAVFNTGYKSFFLRDKS